MRLIDVDQSGRLRGASALLLLAGLMTAGALAAGFWADRQRHHELQSNLRGATDVAAGQLSRALGEFRSLAARVPAAGAPDCSPEALERLRRELFGLDYLRDIGIVRDRTLHCSTTLGEIVDPVRSSLPDLIIDNGRIELYAYRSVRLSLSRPTMVLQVRHMNALVDPVVVEGLSASPWLDGLQVSDRARADWYALYGEPGTEPVGPVPAGSLLAEVCSEQDGFCLRGILGRPGAAPSASGTWLGFAVLGAVAGLAAYLFIQLICLKYCTPAMRIRRALAGGAIKARYQPVFDARSGRMIGVEALARWPSAPSSLRAPDDFVAAAEAGGESSGLTRAMIENVAADLGSWLAARSHLSVAINVAAQDLEGEALETALEDCLLSIGIEPGQIVLEITERSLLGVHRPIQRLAERGYLVHVDDFGEGYSSLAYLHELTLHGVKISRTFVSSLGTDSPKATLVASMVQMANQLGLDIVLEGIETERQREAARALGTLRWQGFLFARPMAGDALQAFEAALEGEADGERDANGAGGGT